MKMRVRVCILFFCLPVTPSRQCPDFSPNLFPSFLFFSFDSLRQRTHCPRFHPLFFPPLPSFHHHSLSLNYTYFLEYTCDSIKAMSPALQALKILTNAPGTSVHACGCTGERWKNKKGYNEESQGSSWSGHCCAARRVKPLMLNSVSLSSAAKGVAGGLHCVSSGPSNRTAHFRTTIGLVISSYFICNVYQT